LQVLVAEDDSVSAELLAGALSQFGYEATIARNGAEAYDLVRTGQYRLLVSDWEMPGINGVDLCRKIRQRQSSGYIYIILVTAHAGLASVVEGLDAGTTSSPSPPASPSSLPGCGY